MRLSKSKQPFIRIQVESDNPVKFLRPFDLSSPINIFINYKGFKRFKNVTIRTEVSFHINLHPSIEKIRDPVNYPSFVTRSHNFAINSFEPIF